MKSINEQLDSIANQFLDLGLEFPAPLVYGKVVRIKAQGDKGQKKSGWYICHEFLLDSGAIAITGKIGNWKSVDEGVTIDVDWKGFSDGELEKLKMQQDKQAADAKKAKLKLQKQTKEKAQKIWEKLPTDGTSPYLQVKKVAAFGLRFSRGSIAVPLFNIEGELVNIQWVDKTGVKRFMTGGEIVGCFHKFGTMTELNTIVVVEGYATGASVHMATKLPVAIAFNCGNLKPVSVALKKQYPELNIVIAADDDRKTKGNPGIKKANEAASSICGKIVIPTFNQAA